MSCCHRGLYIFMHITYVIGFTQYVFPAHLGSQSQKVCHASACCTFDAAMIRCSPPPQGLTKVLPEDIHLRATGRLHISVTRLADRKNLIINRFESRDHLIEALLASRDGSHKDNFGENLSILTAVESQLVFLLGYRFLKSIGPN
jgi:hypothetical protein